MKFKSLVFVAALLVLIEALLCTPTACAQEGNTPNDAPTIAPVITPTSRSAISTTPPISSAVLINTTSPPAPVLEIFVENATGLLLQQVTVAHPLPVGAQVTEITLHDALGRVRVTGDAVIFHLWTLSPGAQAVARVQLAGTALEPLQLARHVLATPAAPSMTSPESSLSPDPTPPVSTASAIAPANWPVGVSALGCLVASWAWTRRRYSRRLRWNR